MKRWMSVLVLMLVAPIAALAQSPSPADALPDPVGHYRLVGQMETAAWLDIGKDGRFRWQLSVGSLDMDVQGDWKRIHDMVVLKADGADAEIAKVIRLDRVSRVDDWTPRLPADHPLNVNPAGIAVRLVDADGIGPASFLAFASTLDHKNVELHDRLLGETDRWLIADAAPGLAINQLHVLIAAKLSRDMDVTLKPGDVAEIVISPAVLGEQERFLMMTLIIGKDGALIPDEERFSERPPRYVRD